MALLSGEVETIEPMAPFVPLPALFRMALLSGEVETSRGRHRRPSQKFGVPDGFAIRGS